MSVTQPRDNRAPGETAQKNAASQPIQPIQPKTVPWNLAADQAAAGSWAERPAGSVTQPLDNHGEEPAEDEHAAEARTVDQSTHSLTPASEPVADSPAERPAPSAGQPERPTPEAAPVQVPPTGVQMPPADTQVHPDFDAIRGQLQRAMGDRFEVIRPLSVGGMATIFQLRSRAHGGLLALKLLHPHLLRQPGIHDAFQREARSLARLSGHPNSVAVVDLLEVDGTPAILMPFVEGEDLDQLLQRTGPLDREQTMMLAAQVASLLMYAESLGLTHGDLAPGNIRLDVFGQYRLIDFGLSRSAESTPSEHAPMAGTPAYNSPEQLRGEVPDIRSDLYALGAILVEARTGHPLFEAASLPELAQLHLLGQWTMPEAVADDPPMAALVRSLLATSLAERMSSSYELTGALAAFGFELPSFAGSLHPDQVEAPRPRRKRLQEG